MAKIWIVSFEPRNTDGFVEAYSKEEDADKRAAEIANEYTDENEVQDAFEQGDYDTAIDLFIQECENGADHNLSIIETELK